MASGIPSVLIIGHSFVKRLSRDFHVQTDPRIDPSFGLQGSAFVKLFGVGGRTVEKMRLFDLGVVKKYSPDIIILEVGTNDLADMAPEVVGSSVDDFIQMLLTDFGVRVVGWCAVIPRGLAYPHADAFHQQTIVLNNYADAVLDSPPNVFCWHHRPFNHPKKDFYLPPNFMSLFSCAPPFLSDTIFF